MQTPIQWSATGIRLLSYNILDGGKGRLDRIIEVIRGQAPDVVALLEACDRSYAETLAAKLDMPFVFGEANNRKHHIAWLSRLPISRSTNHRAVGLAKTLLEIEVLTGSTRVPLFATHLGSRWDIPQPADEVPVILSLLKHVAGTPHALVGDFNDLRPGDPVGESREGARIQQRVAEKAPRRAIGLLLEAGYVDCYRVLHPGVPGYTYPTDCPWLRLDYVFASPELAPHLLACDVVDGAVAASASDHLPVSAEFHLTE